MHPHLVFLGVRNTILALRVEDGHEVWRRHLGGVFSAPFTGLACIGGRLYATCNGKVTCLDPETGEVHWVNPLEGMGTGIVTLAGGGGLETAAASEAAAAANAAAVAAVTVAVSAASTSSS
jgi:outer membrane protein assembly factor BamB